MTDLNQMFPLNGDEAALIEQAGAIYRCPKDADGKRLGPIAGLSSTHPWDTDGEMSYVSDLYINTGMLDRWPHLIDSFAKRLSAKIAEAGLRWEIRGGYFVAAPMGGIQLNAFLARQMEAQVAYTEKAGKRFQFRRCLPPEESAKVIICEDVITSAQTVGQVIQEVEKSGAEVLAICTIVNRSVLYKFSNVPIISLVDLLGDVYSQDDPYVKDDVDGGNVVWAPKEVWQDMLSVMEAHGGRS
jgi:orotate phosphoribosyltransferase